MTDPLNPHGVDLKLDPVAQVMVDAQIPVSRASYLAVAYPDGLPEPWTAELEAQLPPELQQPVAPPSGGPVVTYPEGEEGLYTSDEPRPEGTFLGADPVPYSVRRKREEDRCASPSSEGPKQGP